MKITAQNMNNTANMCMINAAIDDDDDDTFIKVSKNYNSGVETLSGDTKIS